MNEIWKPLMYNNVPTQYLISNMGNIRHRINQMNLHQRLSKKGYLCVNLYIREFHISVRFQVHRLVAKAFVPNYDNKPQVNHINGIKTDNRAENLEWVTNSENMEHATNNGLRPSKLSEEDVHKICSMLEDKTIYASDIAKIFNINPGDIYAIIVGKIWKRISCQYNIQRRKRLTEDEVHEICKLLCKGIDYKAIAEMFAVSNAVIQRIKYRFNWKHISKDYDF